MQLKEVWEEEDPEKELDFCIRATATGQGMLAEARDIVTSASSERLENDFPFPLANLYNP